MVLRPRAALRPERISGERIGQRLTLACVENKGLCIDTVGVRKGITGGSTRVLSSRLQRAKPFASLGLRGRHSERSCQAPFLRAALAARPLTPPKNLSSAYLP